MVRALVLLRVTTGRIDEVAQQLADLDGVSKVYPVAGQYDLVAVLRTSGNDQIATLVTEHILKADGLISSETLIAFRAFSRHDLERMFAVGIEG